MFLIRVLKMYPVFYRWVPFLVCSSLVVSLSGCGGTGLLLLHQGGGLPSYPGLGVVFQKTWVAPKVDVTPSTRVAFLALVSEAPEASDAELKAKREEASLMLDGLDEAAMQQTQFAFHYVQSSEIKGPRILAEKADIDAALHQNNLDLLVLFQPPDLPHGGFFSKVYFDVDAAVLDRQLRPIATFQMNVAFHRFVDQAKLAELWAAGNIDKKSYYLAIGTLTVEHLARWIDQPTLRSENMYFSDSDTEELLELQKKLLPLDRIRTEKFFWESW